MTFSLIIIIDPIISMSDSFLPNRESNDDFADFEITVKRFVEFITF